MELVTKADIDAKYAELEACWKKLEKLEDKREHTPEEHRRWEDLTDEASLLEYEYNELLKEAA